MPCGLFTLPAATTAMSKTKSTAGSPATISKGLTIWSLELGSLRVTASPDGSSTPVTPVSLSMWTKTLVYSPSASCTLRSSWALSP